MARIVLRLLLALVLVTNLIIIVLSYLSGVNIYQKYGSTILKICGIFVLLVVAFYIALALIGIS